MSPYCAYIYIYIYICTYIYIHLFIYLFIYLSIYLFVYLFIYLHTSDIYPKPILFIKAPILNKSILPGALAAVSQSRGC